MIGVYSDTTRRKSEEAQLIVQREQIARLNRVSLLGELSGTLAHELSQPLTAILSNTDAARQMLTTATPDLKEIDAILSDIGVADGRMIEVIDRLRSLFVRGEVPLQQPPPVQPIDVNACIRAVLELEGSYLMAHGVTFSAWAGFDSAGPLTRHSSKRLMTPSSDMRCLDRLRKLHTVESFAVAKA